MTLITDKDDLFNKSGREKKVGSWSYGALDALGRLYQLYYLSRALLLCSEGEDQDRLYDFIIGSSVFEKNLEILKEINPVVILVKDGDLRKISFLEFEGYFLDESLSEMIWYPDIFNSVEEFRGWLFSRVLDVF